VKNKNQKPPEFTAEHLGDFSTTARTIPIALVAILIGCVSAVAADVLLKLIAFFTNLFFYQRLSTEGVTPLGHTLGIVAIFVPIAGALIIGLMARFGSDRIRGHGIPEALESILIRGSRVEARLAVLKPLSAAISIGSGGPFGAEGPIIMTGGAFGSLIAQLIHLTASERKTLLVAGAAAGMSATFDAPLASIMLAIELLLFEWKPRSFVPVALASVTAATVRHLIIGPGPLFSVPVHPDFIGVPALAACALAGILAGVLSAALTKSVYVAEDLFKKLPLHWMWWPAIGAIAIGVGGYIEPRALGVGYDMIETLLSGELPITALLIFVAVKWAIWSIALGSGTSGGVLAPLLLIGGALGALEAQVFPNEGIGFWPLIGMGAILGGTMRSPLTGIVFAMEITHDYRMLMPLTVAVTCAHLFTVLVMKRSVLTEKVARRGYHVTREYTIDPLEVLFVYEVLTPDLTAKIAEDGAVAYSDETLRTVAHRMAETGHLTLAVLDRKGGSPMGVIALADLLQARSRHLEEETRRETVLNLRAFLFQ
jgi:H+/Cl- antiporter ClcA